MKHICLCDETNSPILLEGFWQKMGSVNYEMVNEYQYILGRYTRIVNCEVAKQNSL